MGSTHSAITQTVSLDVTQQAAWRCLTEPEYVSRWLGCMQYEKRVGQVFYMQQDPQKRARNDPSGATHCKILALDAPSLFGFSWYLPGTPATTVSFRLSSTEAGTDLAFSHDGWDQFDEEEIRPVRDALAQGWQSFVLPGFKELAESQP